MIRPYKMQLPKPVVNDILRLRYQWESPHALAMYLHELRRAGWRVKVLAQAANYSGQGFKDILQRHEWQEGSLAEYRLITGLRLEVPEAPAKPRRPRGGKKGKPLAVPTEETMARIRELHPFALRYRGRKKNRAETLEYLELIKYAVEHEGASVYGISKQLGVQASGIQNRLVRHGLTPGNGNSHARKLLKSVTGEGFAPHAGGWGYYTTCSRGHDITDPDNVRTVRSTGNRLCKKCERIRHDNYRARKAAREAAQSPREGPL